MYNNSLITLFIAQLKEWSRSKTALFWSQLFPLVFMVGFPYIFAGGEAERVVFIVPGVLTINMIAASFFGISMNMVTLRETGLLRRFQVTPLHPITVVSAFGLTNLVSILVSMVIQMSVAMLLFNLKFTFDVGVFLLVYLISAFAFIPLGLLVGSVAKDSKTAPAITNLLFFPLMFLSGAAIPLFLMPNWIQSFAKLLPSTYVLELLQGVLARNLSLNHFTGFFILERASPNPGKTRKELYQYKGDRRCNGIGSRK